MSVSLGCIGAAALFLLAAPAFAQFGPPPDLTLSPERPDYFAARTAPLVLCYLPGNEGSALFGERPAERSALDGTVYDELRCNAQVVLLDTPEYRHRVSLRGRKDSTDAEWWRRLREFQVKSAERKIRTELRVNNSFLRRLRQGGEGVEAHFVERLSASTGQNVTAPLISFEAPGTANEESADRLREALRRHFPRALLGTVLEELPEEKEALSDWDYVILRPERLPAWQQGQAAMAFLRARLGQLPIVLRLERPDFYRDLVYYATGAAGFQYDPLPAALGPVRDQQVRALRSFAAMKGRLRDGGTRLMPEFSVPGTLGALGVPGESCFLLLVRGGEVSFGLPASFGQQGFTETWYRPATDELITRPGQRGKGGLLLRPPEGEGAWIWGWHGEL